MSTTLAAPPQTPPPKGAAPPPVQASPAVGYPSPLFLATGPKMHPITVKQYQQMMEAGILTVENVELIEGYLVEKMSRNPPHDGTMDDLESIILALLPQGWMMRVQKAVEMATSQPEPDIAIVRGGRGSFRARHPEPAEVGVLIEVADTSLRFDRAEKVRVYAAAGIREYWIISVPDRHVEVYTQPSGPTVAPNYGSQQTFVAGQSVTLALDGVALGSFAVADVLP